MSAKGEPKDPLAKLWYRIEQDWDKWETLVQIIFTIAGIIFPLIFTYIITNITKEGIMNDFIGAIASISFWSLVICAVLLVRNSGKLTKSKLDEISNQLAENNTKFTELINSMNELIKRMDNKLLNK
nr:hypothetical protein DMOBY_01380 [Dehalococcoides mccartyi]